MAQSMTFPKKRSRYHFAVCVLFLQSQLSFPRCGQIINDASTRLRPWLLIHVSPHTPNFIILLTVRGSAQAVAPLAGSAQALNPDPHGEPVRIAPAPFIPPASADPVRRALCCRFFLPAAALSEVTAASSQSLLLQRFDPGDRR